VLYRAANFKNVIERMVPKLLINLLSSKINLTLNIFVLIIKLYIIDKIIKFFISVSNAKRHKIYSLMDQNINKIV
jgi:hypothetical protein